MKELTTRGINISPYLSKKEAELVVAATSPKLSSLQDSGGIKQIINIINRAYIEMDKAPSGLNSFERKRYLDVFAKLIFADLLLYFPETTMPEVEIAVRNGIRREYGDFYNLSVVAIHMFVEKYLASEERSAALLKQEQLRSTTEDRPLDEETIWKIISTGIMSCYNNYMKSKRVIDVGNSTYDYIVKAGYINLTNEEKQEIYDLALLELKRESQFQECISYHMWQLAKNSAIRNDIHAKSKAKEIALRRFFDQRPDMEKVIENVHRTYRN